MDEFTMQLAVCIAAAAMFALSGTATPMFALAAFALSQAGYFALMQMKKGGVPQLWTAALLVVAAFACYFITALFFGAVNSLSALAYIPAMFILPSVVVAAREVFLSG